MEHQKAEVRDSSVVELSSEAMNRRSGSPESSASMREVEIPKSAPTSILAGAFLGCRVQSAFLCPDQRKMASIVLSSFIGPFIANYFAFHFELLRPF